MFARDAFVINGNRTALTRQIPVVVNRDEFVCDPFADPAAIERSAASIEITLETMPDGFVQQHPTATASNDHLHFARRCCNRLEIRRSNSRGIER